MTNWLLLIPTEFERKFLTSVSGLKETTVEICGFGPIVAAAKTAELINRHQPDRVMLLGIAGSYPTASETGLVPGSASVYSSVGCYGVGVGSGDRFETASEMGWQPWSDADSNPIGDWIQLDPEAAPMNRFPIRQLLTVCAASGNKEDVARRLKKFPDAVAEDMEGFAVATACQFLQKPLTIVRGISNVAGDREKINWKIEEALVSAQSLAAEIIQNAGT